MIIDTLVIEVTRRCNMACEHCLRGCSQNVDIPFETIDRIFEGVQEVYSLTFTGGEPFLNIDAIEYTLKYVKEHCIPVHSVFVVTNGKHFEERYITVMNEWIMYVTSFNINLDAKLECGDTIWEIDELSNYSGLAVSRDPYHEQIPLENYIRYRLLSYYSEVKEREDYNGSIILEGNAYENGLIGQEREGDKFDFYDWEVEDFEIGEDKTVSLVYVSCLGEVLADCDRSYEHMAEESIGNINEYSLLELFRFYALNEEAVA